jgi:hypothetical protein
VIWHPEQCLPVIFDRHRSRAARVHRRDNANPRRGVSRRVFEQIAEDLSQIGSVAL